jgi:hypothetical protein
MTHYSKLDIKQVVVLILCVKKTAYNNVYKTYAVL